MEEAQQHGKRKPRGKPVEFNQVTRFNHNTLHESKDILAEREWVTGFAKRKQKRRELGAIQLAKKQRLARNAARKERREAMKITDRLTGAFGEKHEDDSDNELGDEAQNPEEFEKLQKEKKTIAKQQQKNRHEDEEAVVTVVTREQNSDEEDDDDDEDDDDEEDDDADEEMDGPKPLFRRQSDKQLLAEALAARSTGASSTPYNPSQRHQSQANALAKAKQTIRQKDKMAKKGIKGGHKYKRAKITSKKKKIKFGSKKGANREK